ncbi:uncharacterized protein RHO25_005004 [Cercospora beticola]|uniref:Apple domain-containing protein n=1 Tax=Cercospora beticola TaxID=122368 RepID=A0ABZ0NLG8_CERBT|nr:hypothetical protein RHO25_005004 [Cercospora beticola]CAK1361409.1 unnamed protein product [Cercospora beticola]
MKFTILSLLPALALATPVSQPNAEGSCLIEGVRGAVRGNLENSATVRFLNERGVNTVEACRALCHSAGNAQCKAFIVVDSGMGTCKLYNTTLSVRPDATFSSTYYQLPAGIVGGTPHNNPPWLVNEVDTSKTKGNYVGCREYCLEDPRCKGFAFKDGSNCRKYAVSIQDRVGTGPSSGVYNHHYVDCRFGDLPPRT